MIRLVGYSIKDPLLAKWYARAKRAKAGSPRRRKGARCDQWETGSGYA